MTRTRYRCPMCGSRERFDVTLDSVILDADGKIIRADVNSGNVIDMTCDACGENGDHDWFLARNHEWKDDD